MKKYYVIVEEILSRTVVVEAECEEEAILKAKDMYYNQKVVLDYSDLCATNFDIDDSEEI